MEETHRGRQRKRCKERYIERQGIWKWMRTLYPQWNLPDDEKNSLKIQIIYESKLTQEVNVAMEITTETSALTLRMSGRFPREQGPRLCKLKHSIINALA